MKPKESGGLPRYFSKYLWIGFIALWMREDNSMFTKA